MCVCVCVCVCVCECVCVGGGVMGGGGSGGVRWCNVCVFVGYARIHRYMLIMRCSFLNLYIQVITDDELKTSISTIKPLSHYAALQTFFGKIDINKPLCDGLRLETLPYGLSLHIYMMYRRRLNF
jgi:hypothetical protein